MKTDKVPLSMKQYGQILDKLSKGDVDLLQGITVKTYDGKSYTLEAYIAKYTNSGELPCAGEMRVKLDTIKGLVICYEQQKYTVSQTQNTASIIESALDGLRSSKERQQQATLLEQRLQNFGIDVVK
jgi:hypothetical protein